MLKTAAIRAFRLIRPHLSRTPPIVVGATGGSGTRALHGVLARGGVFMGVRLNHAGDAMDFEPMLDAVINRVLVETGGLDYETADLPPRLRDEVFAQLDEALLAYQAERPIGMPWGWKNPRSMYLLPFVQERFPGLAFVHVVRDGRDMALSDNQNQLRKHYGALFGSGGADAEEAPLASLRLWASANGAVADRCERRMGGRYLRVRLEDLCAASAATCADLAERLALPVRNAELLGSGIVPPSSLGRWRAAPEELWQGMPAGARETLARFGYPVA